MNTVIIISNLVNRPVRTLVSVLAVAMEEASSASECRGLSRLPNVISVFTRSSCAAWVSWDRRETL